MSESGNSIDPFRLLLVDLSDELQAKDVDRLKYLAGIGKAVEEVCDSGLDVFRELVRLRTIADNNVDFLKQLMKSVKRHDLVIRIGMVIHLTYY